MAHHWNEQCGVFAVYGHPEAANLTYLGLHALQHRGQESAGIVSMEGEELFPHRASGLVADVFDREKLDQLKGSMAIGHVRYSTSGDSDERNAQPFHVEYSRGPLAVAHNGNLVNAQRLRDELQLHGSLFQSETDTEVVVHLLAASQEPTLRERIVHALSQVLGAYSMVFLSEGRIFAVRDPSGFRPLVLGTRDGAYFVSSETCSLDLVGASFVRDVEPGELLEIDSDGVRSFKPFDEKLPMPCCFEHIYFSRPDSVVFGRSVYKTRNMLGRLLATEHPVEADVVVPVPDSGVPAGLGYAQALGIPFQMGLVRSHYRRRTFIEPRQSIRHFGVKVKLNAVRDVLKDRRVVLVDDSLVRGTTSRKIAKMVRESGAREIHLRVASPPIKFPCYYGIDTPTRRELIAATHKLDEINRYLTTDSLRFLSMKGLEEALGSDEFCRACFDGGYPVLFPRQVEVLPRFEKGNA